MTKYTDKQIIEACELRERGLSYRQIAMKTGMHKASVLEYCQANGAVSPKAKRIPSAFTFTPEDDAVILDLRRGGVRPADIARQVGRADKSIRNRLRSLAFNETLIEAGVRP